MATRNPDRAKERKKRYLLKKKIEKYGPDAANVDMRGRHGNHATGDRNARWSGDRLVTEHGYIAVKVPVDHPHAWGPPRLKRYKYAYEHIVMMMAHIGRPLRPDEVVHHRNGKRADNRLDNLELTTNSEHAREHGGAPGARDRLGRFQAGVPRTTEEP
ncbi:HNH endonuclease [Sorangium sp. So ce134]